MVNDMKYLAYILFAIVGLGASYWVFYNGGEVNVLSVLFGYWAGYFAHVILSWGDKK